MGRRGEGDDDAHLRGLVARGPKVCSVMGKGRDGGVDEDKREWGKERWVGRERRMGKSNEEVGEREKGGQTMKEKM